MRRLTRGRAAPDDEATPQAGAASEPVGVPTDAPQGDSAVPAGEGDTNVLTPATAGHEPVKADSGDATDATAVEEPGRDLPAGVEPVELGAVPTSERRSRLRKRLRYLRAVREILLRDLGGFYLEAHRSTEGPDSHRRLLDAKSSRLATLEAEVRELEDRLGEPHAKTVLREPGVGGTCPHCGELHGSEARFCGRCGQPLGARARRSAPATTTPAREGEKQTTASLWGRPKRPDPAAATAGAIDAPATGEATMAAAPGGTEPGADEAAAGGRPARDEPAGGQPARDEPVGSEGDAPAREGEPAQTGSERS